jgi:hypothetical protein
MTQPSTTQRDELAETLNEAVEVFYEPFDWHESTRIAAKILAAGYRKPTVLGYVVVGRDGGMVTGSSYTTRAEAHQAIADEWTVGAKTNQIDWDYRVSEIVEAAK